MVLIRFLRFISGYLRIYVTGRFPERFLNICATQGIRVWNTRRSGEGIEICAYVRDYRVMRRLRRRCAASLKVRRKYGLPFITSRYRRRKGLLVGAAVYITALALLPRLVWGVNISGNERLSEERVSEVLRDVGIYPGVSVDSIDADNMRLRLALLLPDISWAAINIDGCFVNVDLREADHKLETDNRPSNMVAAYDGRITAVYVKNGTAAVKVGDAVVKGDMLVSGTEQYSSGETVFRHSDARIIAEVERSLTVEIPLKEKTTKDTGNVKKRYVLNFFDYSLPLYIGQVDYAHRLEAELKPITVGAVKLPISLTEGRFFEVEAQEHTLTVDQAYQKGIKQLDSTQKELLDGFEVLKRNVSADRKDDTLILTATYLCKGDIAKTEYFYIAGQ